MSHFLREFCATLKASGIVEEFHRLARAESKHANIVPDAQQGLARRGQRCFKSDGSSATVFYDGQPFVWGVPPKIKPISNVPFGARMRFRFRHDAEGVVILRTSTGLECWSLDDYGDHWQLGVCHGSNIREANLAA